MTEQRPRYLARRHSLPDPELAGLSPSEAALFKMRAKAEFAGICEELAKLRQGGFSNYQAAQELLGDRCLEGTVRGWKNPKEPTRAPRTAELELARAVLEVERRRAFAGLEAALALGRGERLAKGKLHAALVDGAAALVEREVAGG